jgi:hypothetical protein
MRNGLAPACAPGVFVSSFATVFVNLQAVSAGEETLPPPGIYEAAGDAFDWTTRDITGSIPTPFALTCDAKGQPLFL